MVAMDCRTRDQILLPAVEAWSPKHRTTKEVTKEIIEIAAIDTVIALKPTVINREGFPGGSVVNNPTANAGDTGLIPGLIRLLGEGNGNPVQYSFLGNPMDRGAWWATVHGVTKESDMTEQLTLSLSLTQHLPLCISTQLPWMSA